MDEQEILAKNTQNDFIERHFLGIVAAIGIVFMLLFVSAGFFIGRAIYHADAVQLDDGGAEGIADELDAAVGTQQSITGGIGSAEERIDGIAESIDAGAAGVRRAEERAGYAQGYVAAAGEIIADCQRILAEVERRGEADAAKD